MLFLEKKLSIDTNSTIKSFSHIENVRIGKNVSIGPFARLRPGTIIKSGSKIGNFVEVKKSTIGKNSKLITYLILGIHSLEIK